MSDSSVLPVDASTIILVRHGEPVGSPWQCYMVRRHVRSEFAADVYVFPGGKVDAADAEPELLARVDSEPHPREHGESRERWLALQVAAIRELFEEAGVLLARGAEGGLVRFQAGDGQRFDACRRRLHEGDITFLEMLTEENLRLAADRLHPFSRWITPVDLPRRYDTRFFVAGMPHSQVPRHDSRETTDGVWIAPQDALERSGRGEFPLVFPTEAHLKRMAAYRSIEQMIAETSEADLQPVMPRIVQEGAETIFLLPGDEGYEA